MGVYWGILGYTGVHTQTGFAAATTQACALPGTIVGVYWGILGVYWGILGCTGRLVLQLRRHARYHYTSILVLLPESCKALNWIFD